MAEGIDGWERELAERDQELQDEFWRVISIDWADVHATRFAMRHVWDQQNDLQWLRRRLRAHHAAQHEEPPPQQTQTNAASPGNMANMTYK